MELRIACRQDFGLRTGAAQLFAGLPSSTAAFVPLRLLPLPPTGQAGSMAAAAPVQATVIGQSVAREGASSSHAPPAGPVISPVSGGAPVIGQPHVNPEVSLPARVLQLPLPLSVTGPSVATGYFNQGWTIEEFQRAPTRAPRPPPKSAKQRGAEWRARKRLKREREAKERFDSIGR